LALDPNVTRALGGKFKLDPSERGIRKLRLVSSLADMSPSEEHAWVQASLVQLGASAVISGTPEDVADYDEVLTHEGGEEDSTLMRRAALRTALLAWSLPAGGFAPRTAVAMGDLIEGLPRSAVSDAIYGFGSLRWTASVAPPELAAQHSVASALLAWIIEHASPDHAVELLGWAPYVHEAYVARWIALFAKVGGSPHELASVESAPLRLALDLYIQEGQDPAQVAQVLDGGDERLRAAALDAACTFSKSWCFGALARILASPRLLRLAEGDRRRAEHQVSTTQPSSSPLKFSGRRPVRRRPSSSSTGFRNRKQVSPTMFAPPWRAHSQPCVNVAKVGARSPNRLGEGSRRVEWSDSRTNGSGVA